MQSLQKQNMRAFVQAEDLLLLIDNIVIFENDEGYFLKVESEF